MDREKSIGPRLLIKNALYALGVVWRMSRKVFFVQILNALFEALIPLIQAYIAGQLISELAAIPAGNGNQRQLLILVVATAGTQLLSLLLTSLKNYYLSAKREKLELILDDQLLQAQTALPLETLELAETRDRYTYAEEGMRYIFWFVDSVMSLLSGLISIVGILLLIVSTIPWATIILAPLPFLSVVLKYKNYKAYRTMWDEQRPHRMRSYRIRNMLSNESGILEVRLYGLLSKLVSMWRKESTLAIDTRLKDEARNIRASTIISILESAVGLCIDIWLVFQVIGLHISLGLFEQTRRLVSNYILSLSRISSAATDITLNGYRVNDYRTFVKDTSDKLFGTQRLSQPQDITMQNVSFAYPKGSGNVLTDVSLTIKAGETVAIVGENGAGKTTLFKVLLGVYTARNGSVAYNGTDIHDYDQLSIYKNIAPLFQEFQYYDFLNIGESVMITGASKDKSHLQRVLKLVGLWEFVQKQPKKLDANIGYVEEDGIKLSGGQWQRLAIARALYKQAPILILDEPTSAIDAKSEQEIMDAVFDMYKDKILITVSHRLSTVSRADRIIVLKDGKIVEDGTHKALWKKGTAYHDLFQKQAIQG